MTTNTTEFLIGISEYSGLFLIFAIIFLLIFVGVVAHTVYTNIKANKKQKKVSVSATKQDLKNLDYRKVKRSRKGEILREMIAADGVDPGPNSYLVINDGGVDVYERSFTISSMPKRTSFAETFSMLMDFPDCVSSVFVNPIAESTISRKMDRQINILEAEGIAADGDPNRTRKLRSQFRELNGWAEDIEEGETKFFSVGFVFTLSADSLQELNKKSDTFHSKALSRQIEVTNCFAVQSEAFVSNAPGGKYYSTGSAMIKADAINFFDMDKHSVSTIFNYTQASFSHKEGIPLGRDMANGDPVLFDLFDPSHDGFTLIIAGKTGSGKSATIKIYASRSMLYGFRYVCIDSQQRKGTNEGEFASIAELYNGVNFKICNDSPHVLNPFEIGETTKTIKEGNSVVREIRTLELKEKVGMAVNTLLTMIQGSKSFKNLESMIPINRILTDICTNMYHDFGIYEDRPDTLYEDGEIVQNGVLVNGKVKKKLPTMTDFYKGVLIADKKNTDLSLVEYYNLIKMALKDFVRELYYSNDTIHFFTREQYLQLPIKDVNSASRTWRNEQGNFEDVEQIHGIRAYYDGQSTISIGTDCPFTNIDISLLSESEKILARQIGIDFINELYIKKNSESIDTATKLVAIFDECHENFTQEYARKTLDNVVRTARKRHVSVILSSQTLKEYDNYTETQAILKQATSKFVFKQDYQDRSFLIDTVGFTESQADYILNKLGGSGDVEEDKGRHRGEVCIMDNKQVCFCKVDYLKETEALAVDTDANVIQKLFHKNVG